jgi:uncharacterized protein YjbK
MEEHEIKQLLTEEMYLHILHYEAFNHFNKKRQIQINYYYDTSDYTLYHQDITLRVRQIDQNLMMEIKYTVEDNGSYKVKKEICKPISEFPMFINLDRLFDDLPIKGEAMQIHALITERTRIKVSEHILIDIDKSSYFGKTDYELEIEFAAGHYEEAFKIFRIFFPNEETKSSCGKKTRFFNRYFELMNISEMSQ